EEAWDFRKGLAPVKYQGKWGFIDRTGSFLIQPQFDWAYSFHEGLARARIGEKEGYIDQNGKWAIQPQFDSGGDFEKGLASVQFGEKVGLIDKSGKLVVGPLLDDVVEPEKLDDGTQIEFHRSPHEAEGLFAVRVDGKWSFMNRSGQFLMPPQ